MPPFVYESNTTPADIVRRLLAAKKVLLTTHVKPDGDAMGSCLALHRALQSKAIAADIYLAGPVDQGLRTIAADTPFHLLDKKQPASDHYDLAIVVDTGAWSQLEAITPWLKKHYDKTIIIDHHPRGDDIAAQRWIDPAAVSTTAMLVELLDSMRCELSGGAGGIAEALFTGLATDSGWFRFPNAGPRAFEIAARLLKAGGESAGASGGASGGGVDKPRLYQILEESFGPQRLALEARALASLEYANQGSIAIQSLTMNDFKETGATVEDLTGLVNMPLVVGSVRASILLSQTEKGKTKLSFRSKGPPPEGEADDFIDVNELANQFGGGGHIHAAGARLNMDIQQAKARVLEGLKALMVTE